MLAYEPTDVKVLLVLSSTTRGSTVGLEKVMMVGGSPKNIWKVFVVLFMNTEIGMIGPIIVAMKRIRISLRKLKIKIKNACDVNWTVYNRYRFFAGNMNKTVPLLPDKNSTVSATIENTVFYLSFYYFKLQKRLFSTI